jgi:hypothetical protein
VDGRRTSRLFCGRSALAAAAGRFGAVAGRALVAGLRGAAAVFTAGRLVLAALGWLLLRPLAVTLRLAAGALRTGRLTAGFAAAFALGRGAATLRVAVACLAAAAAAFVALATGRRGLFAALLAEERFPDPLAGVDAFIPAVSPSSASRERREPSTRLRASPGNEDPAIPWTAGPEPA